MAAARLTACPEARAALAEAIRAVAAIDRDLAVNGAAIERAAETRREARRNLERLSRAGEAGPDVERFLSAVEAGGELDVAALAPERTKQEELASLQTAVDRWSQMLAGCEAAREDLSRKRERAMARRDDAVAEVVRQSDPARVFLEGLAELQAEVFARRYVLSRLTLNRLVSPEEAAEVRQVLRGLERLPHPEMLLSHWGDAAPGARWQAAIDALATDPETELPTLGALLAPA